MPSVGVGTELRSSWGSDRVGWADHPRLRETDPKTGRSYGAGGEGLTPLSLDEANGCATMTQVDDLSRCLAAFDQHTTLTVVVEMSARAGWCGHGNRGGPGGRGKSGGPIRPHFWPCGKGGGGGGGRGAGGSARRPPPLGGGGAGFGGAV